MRRACTRQRSARARRALQGPVATTATQHKRLAHMLQHRVPEAEATLTQARRSHHRAVAKTFIVLYGPQAAPAAHSGAPQPGPAAYGGNYAGQAHSPEDLEAGPAPKQQGKAWGGNGTQAPPPAHAPPAGHARPMQPLHTEQAAPHPRGAHSARRGLCPVCLRHAQCWTAMMQSSIVQHPDAATCIGTFPIIASERRSRVRMIQVLRRQSGTQTSGEHSRAKCCSSCSASFLSRRASRCCSTSSTLSACAPGSTCPYFLPPRHWILKCLGQVCAIACCAGLLPFENGDTKMTASCFAR